ncbi:DUF6873 family GME fold protein [Peptoclostridium acidaminophilum]|nr:hypothetical protein [Peptoclostridium acidaminophilum]
MKILKFIENSFIPQGNATMFIIDSRTPDEAKDMLVKRGQIIETKPSENTYAAISGHPDISVCHLGGREIVVAPDSFEHYKELLSIYGFNVICGRSELQHSYPHNIQYNVAFVGKHAIHNFRHTDTVILEHIRKNGYVLVDVKQGYSKCSTCVIDGNSIITSDEGIHRAAMNFGIESLLIEKGGISLEGFEYGFIGGCSGLISENEIAFIGDLTEHACYRAMREFIEKRNREIVILGEFKLADYGSIIPLLEEQPKYI